MANLGLSAPVVNGQLTTNQATPDNTTESKRGTGELGKDAFLQLLVTQMKYQDPLNPTSDTEYISQLATFSSLEEMQNLNTTMEHMKGYNLVGEYVMVKTDGEEGTEGLTGGKVDYVFVENNKMYMNINGNDYSLDDLDTVVTEEYVKSLSNKGNNTAADLAQAADLIGKSVTVTDDEGKSYTGEAFQAFMDNGTVYIKVGSKNYKYDNLVSVNMTEDANTKKQLDYLELLTADVSELKELLAQVKEEQEKETEKKAEKDTAIEETMANDKVMEGE